MTCAVHLSWESNESATEIKQGGNDTRELALAQEWLDQEDLAKDSFAVEPEVNPNVERSAKLDDINQEDQPSDGSDNSVYECVVHKPAEPVGYVTHTHHAHAFFATRLFLFYDHVD